MAVHPLALARSAFGVGPLVVSRQRKYLALGIAFASDLIQVALFPSVVEGALSPVDWAIDSITALLLVLVVGWNWRLALAFAVELVPGIDLFPTWGAMMLTITAGSAEPPALDDATPPKDGWRPPAASPRVAKTLPGGAPDPAAPALYTKRSRRDR